MKTKPDTVTKRDTVTKPSKRPAAPGRVMWLHPSSFTLRSLPDQWNYCKPALVLPLADKEKLLEGVARAIDQIAFHRYKEGDCLPRGHECDTVEHVNEIQGFRQRSAESKARAVLRHLGVPL